MFNHLFFSAFQLLKPRFKRKANTLAILYISILQTLIALIFGIFFYAFFKNMNSGFLSDEKAWFLFILVAIVLFFKNWIQYSGKKRKVLNSKLQRTEDKTYSVWGLVLFPLGCLILLFILNKAM